MNEQIKALWPELEWIQDEILREKTAQVWEYAFERSAIKPEDLARIPFTHLTKRTVSFLAHKRSVVQIVKAAADIMNSLYGNALPINTDFLLAGAILIDVGKLLEYTMKDGVMVMSAEGKLLKHCYSGVALADRFGLPAEVQHIIATHSLEGALSKRSIESYIVHHADFLTYEPFTVED